MKFVHVLVEGPTEETFLRDVMNPYLFNYDVYLNAIIITTKGIETGKNFKGGTSKYNKIRGTIYRLLGDSTVVAVTTMIDYYKLPSDFPSKNAIHGNNCFDRVSYLEEQFAMDIAQERFIPFFVLHEFEAYLFTLPEYLIDAFPELKNEEKKELMQIGKSCSSPEEINDGEATHPSARIKRLIPTYGKVSYGSIIAKRIGLIAIKERCPHFNKWVSTLESIGKKG
ncbi:DUF4276 family protein [bacterium]|nr:DUF4276 family protein [bacterium]MBU1754624.1 DUF4276 family protein [bacterium]